jgi:hypothetical protein
MNLTVSIAAAVTVAVTARMVHLLFLSGKTITGAGIFGRFVARTEQARVDFVDGWRGQGWTYRLIAYPCILASVGVVSLMLYWMLPPLGKFDSLGDVVRYCLLLFGVGVSSSLVAAFILIFAAYFARSVLVAWWQAREDGNAGERAEASPPPAAPDSPDGHGHS